MPFYQKTLDNSKMKKEKCPSIISLHGSFQLNKDVPIHSWYNYITGFSSDFVNYYLRKYRITQNMNVLDPFVGVGTTSIVCKQNKVNSVGVEINPFIVFVARTKLNWDLNVGKLISYVKNLDHNNYNLIKDDELNNEPDLIKRAFSPKILKKLLYLRKKIDLIQDEKIGAFFLLGLVSILKEVSNCKNFAPYLEFKKKQEFLKDIDVFKILKVKLVKMIDDLNKIHQMEYGGSHKVYLKDCRDLSFLKRDFFDLVITSPPYLNNWDYGHITLIELYFLNYAQSYKDVTKIVRNKLVKSSTYVLQNVPNNPKIIIPFKSIKEKLEQLRDQTFEIRSKKKSGKKYDIIIISYFNDMYTILRELYRIMKPNSTCNIVVGDSGLYGIHVPTDSIILEIGEKIGFLKEDLVILRRRLATRHRLKLRESVVSLRKI